MSCIRQLNSLRGFNVALSVLLTMRRAELAATGLSGGTTGSGVLDCLVCANFHHHALPIRRVSYEFASCGATEGCGGSEASNGEGSGCGGTS